MGFFNFVKSAGANLFTSSDEKERAENIKTNIEINSIKVEDLKVTCDDDTACIEGRAGTRACCEKIILIAGNTEGIAKVEDKITVDPSLAPPQVEVAATKPSRFHTVESGDSLSKISKEVYGDPMKYTVIFEANKPMLADPDKIYPGQVLRIPDISA